MEVAIYATQAEGTSRSELAARWRAEGEREKTERAELRKKVEEEEQKVAEMDAKSEHRLHLHHAFAKGVTIVQIAIAPSAIAALTRRKSMWWVSLGLGVVGAAFFVTGLIAR